MDFADRFLADHAAHFGDLPLAGAGPEMKSGHDPRLLGCALWLKAIGALLVLFSLALFVVGWTIAASVSLFIGLGCLMIVGDWRAAVETVELERQYRQLPERRLPRDEQE